MKYASCLSMACLMALTACSSHLDAEKRAAKAVVIYDLAFASYSRGELIPALASVTEALKLSPEFFDAINLKGLIYFRQGKNTQAEEAFQQAIKIDPKRSEVWNNLGTLYYVER